MYKLILREHILFKEHFANNIQGAIWYGSAYKQYPMKWNFGQFEENILNLALYLISRDERVTNTKKGVRHLASPVWIARILSTQVNSQNDDGVLGILFSYLLISSMRVGSKIRSPNEFLDWKNII